MLTNSKLINSYSITAGSYSQAGGFIKNNYFEKLRICMVLEANDVEFLLIWPWPKTLNFG